MFSMGYAPEGFWEIFDWIASNFIKYALAFMLFSIGLYFISKFCKTIAEKKILKADKVVKIKAPEIEEKEVTEETE